jgi:hypothetical protein
MVCKCGAKTCRGIVFLWGKDATVWEQNWGGGVVQYVWDLIWISRSGNDLSSNVQQQRM